MGGGLFARSSAPGEPTLSTPRLSPADYERLKATYLEKLQAYFQDAQVACLQEAPQKTDYGDIDIIVACDQDVDFVELAQHLRAKGVICHHPRFCSVAVRREHVSEVMDRTKEGVSGVIDAGNVQDVSQRPVIYRHVNQNNAKSRTPSSELTSEAYAQIDIELVPCHLFAWRMWYSAYGDLGGMIGNIARALGFTVGQEGLWLRMKELDDTKTLPYVIASDKDGMLLLSNDAEQVMKFLGLDSARFARGFATLEEMYLYLSECRLLDLGAIKKRNLSRDRQKEAKRSVFSRFFDEWLPNHVRQVSTSSSGEPSVRPNGDADLPTEPGKADIDVSRKALCKEAVDFFEKHNEYEAMHTALVRNVENATAVHLLKSIVKLHSGREDKKLNEIARAFRRWVAVSENSEMSVLSEPHTDTESELYRLLAEDKQSLANWQAVNDWASAHWEELKTLERHRAKAA